VGLQIMYDKIVTSKKMTNQKVVFEPFILWSRTDGDVLEIKEGISKLAYSEMPKTSSDFKDPVVSKALLLYEIGSMDKITEMPMPD